MRNLLLLLALAAGSTLAAHAQTPAATDASGVPLINPHLLASGTSTPAQTPPAARRSPLPPDQLADRQSQRLAGTLGLSADQQGKGRPILLSEYQGRAATRQQAQAVGQRRGLRRAVQASRSQADKQLRAVLTPDQYARYQQLLAQRRDQARQRRQAGTGSNLLDD